jgi:uncharacterized protein
MLSDAIRTWNPWWIRGEISKELVGIDREMLPQVIDSIDSKMMKAIIGPRRAGKTTLMYQTIKHLIEHGTDPDRILFLNFDDNNIFNSELDNLIQECLRISPKISYLFLDEVQSRKDWDRWVRTFYDTGRFKQIFISGSSSTLLKKEVSDVLAGRHITFHLLPFSFREFITCKVGKFGDPKKFEHDVGKILHLLDEFMQNGGYPETIGLNEPILTSYLNELFDDVIARDISARYGADYTIARKLAYYLHSNTSKIQSYRSISRSLKVSPDTVSKYVEYLKEAYIVHPLERFSFKLKEQLSSATKYYSIDQGMARAVSFRFSEEKGRILENIVMIEILRRSLSKPDSTSYYFLTDSRKEIDFITMEKDRVERAFQVCLDISNQSTFKREIGPLLEVMKKFDLKVGYIITDNTEKVMGFDDVTIKIIPVWKWLLGIDG